MFFSPVPIWRRRSLSNGNHSGMPKDNRISLIELTQSAAEGNVKEKLWSEGDRCYSSSGRLRLQPFPSFMRPAQSGNNNQNTSEQNKGKTLQTTTVESQHGSLQFTPNVTHWSVKCIYATPNKQDNVDSVSEVVWIKHLVHDCGRERPIPDYSWKSVIDIDINSTCSLTFLPWIYIKYQ